MLTSKRSSSAARKCGKPKPLTTIVLVPPILTSQRRSSFPPLTAAAKVQLYAAVEGVHVARMAEARARGCLAGRLREESYNEVVAEATNLFYKDSEQATGDSRRGDFIAVSAGVSFGGGQKSGPGALLNNKRNCTICSQMVLSWAIMGIVGFATGISLYLIFFPPSILHAKAFSRPTHRNYSNTIRRHLTPSTPISATGVTAFSACTFNFGPHTITVPHVNAANLVWGLVLH
ncbi:hypothetical protein R3P38DRAFT_3225575 [Favolaschia claudopus]|uniref:Uncharacterized protein n=1 Tax=Favolaschia claudopus TaxID=2862362 RepID=A0AAV9ZUH9_9AGAR